MKILCVADQVEPLIHSLGVRERFPDVDLVLGAGDLPMDYLSYIVSALNRPLLFVFGNHNTEDLPYYRPGVQAPPVPLHDYRYDSGATYTGFRIRHECGLTIVGFGGSLRYNNGPNQFSQAEMWARVLLLAPLLWLRRILTGRGADIVLTHAPPRGIHDRTDLCHQGFAAFEWLIRVFRPEYLVHGHVHLYDRAEARVTRYHDTTVINAFGWWLIDTEADGA